MFFQKYWKIFLKVEVFANEVLIFLLTRHFIDKNAFCTVNHIKVSTKEVLINFMPAIFPLTFSFGRVAKLYIKKVEIIILLFVFYRPLFCYCIEAAILVILGYQNCYFCSTFRVANLQMLDIFSNFRKIFYITVSLLTIWDTFCIKESNLMSADLNSDTPLQG